MATTAEPSPRMESTDRPTTAKAYGVTSPTSPVGPLTIERRALRPEDVAIQISHCGICHTDLHFAHNDWGMSEYPMVPGHEIVGRVTGVGSGVTKYKAGDLVAVGCLVDSDLTCEECRAGFEQFCAQMPTFTYSGRDRQDGSLTQGGYSDHIIVREEFVCRVPDGLDPARAAPLLCAGVTTYSPLKRFNVGLGQKVAVVGLGGLGHLGVKLAHAMGAEVTMVTTSPEKGEDARKLGAEDVLISTDADAMAAAAGRFHFILDTIPVAHEVQPYVNLLRPHGAIVLVGALEPLPGINGFSLIFGNRIVAGSAIGGLRETQEMLDFCAEHDVMPEIEVIRASEINQAWDRLVKGDVRYRFVIDMATIEGTA